MNVLVDRQLLALALRHMHRVDALVNLTAGNGGIVLHGASSGVHVEIRLEAAVDIPGSVDLEIAVAQKALKACMANSLVRIEREMTKFSTICRVHAGVVDVRLICVDPGNRAPVPREAGPCRLFIPADGRGVLRRLVMVAAPTDADAKYDYLKRVHFDPGPIQGVATNGNRLVFEDLPGAELPVPLDVPRAVAETLATIPDRLGASALRMMTAEDGCVHATCGRVCVTFREPSEPFTDWRPCIPARYDSVAVLDRGRLRQALLHCGSFIADGVVRMTMEDAYIVLQAKALAREIREEVSCEGELPECFVNARMMAEMLDGTGDVRICASDDFSPLTWSTDHGGAVLMPARPN